MTVDPLTVRVLQAHRARQAKERLVIESDWPESDLVFRTAFGEPVYPDTPSQLLPKLIDAYNKQHPSTPLRRIRLHDLRHIHATTCCSPGCPCTWSRRGWVMPIRASRCGSTPTSSRS